MVSISGSTIIPLQIDQIWYRGNGWLCKMREFYLFKSFYLMDLGATIIDVSYELQYFLYLPLLQRGDISGVTYFDIDGGRGAAQILNLENGPLKQHEKYTLTDVFFKKLPLQILTKICSSFSPLVPKELSIQVLYHRTCKKIEKFGAISS